MHNKHDATRETSVHLLSRHHLVQMSSNGDSETVAYGTKTGHLVANGIDGVASEQTKSGAAVETVCFIKHYIDIISFQRYACQDKNRSSYVY